MLLFFVMSFHLICEVLLGKNQKIFKLEKIENMMKK